MIDRPTLRLSSEEIGALKFSAHRQLTRWAKNPQLRPREQARRDALVSAARVLADNALSGGCQLRPTPEARMPDDWRKIDRGLFESPDGHWRIANPWRLNTELRHRWLVAERRCDRSGWTMHNGDHATLHDARAHVESLDDGPARDPEPR